MGKKIFKLIDVYACETTRQVCLFNASNKILRLLHKRCPHLDAITLTMILNDDVIGKDLKLHSSTELTKFRLEPSQPRDISHVSMMPSFFISDLPFPKLKVLSLVSAFIDNKMLAGLHTLRYLTLSDCYRGKSYYDVDGVCTVLANLSFLEALHLTEQNFTFHFPRLYEVLSERKTLRCLQLRGTIPVPEYRLDSGSIGNFEIMTIRLGNSLCSLNIAFINDNALRLIAKNLRKLKFVNLSWNSEITDSGFHSFSGHPCLEVVDLTECRELSYDSIALTIETLPRIEKLTVTDFSNRAELDRIQFSQLFQNIMNHLKVDIKREWAHYPRDLCQYCESVFR